MLLAFLGTTLMHESPMHAAMAVKCGDALPGSAEHHKRQRSYNATTKLANVDVAASCGDLGPLRMCQMRLSRSPRLDFVWCSVAGSARVQIRSVVDRRDAGDQEFAQPLTIRRRAAAAKQDPELAGPLADPQLDAKLHNQAIDPLPGPALDARDRSGQRSEQGRVEASAIRGRIRQAQREAQAPLAAGVGDELEAQTASTTNSE